MERPWRSLGEATSRRTTVTMVVVVVAMAALVIGLGRLDFATGQDSYLSGDDPAAVANEHYQSAFGGEAMVVLLTMDDGAAVEDLFTAANLDRFTTISETLHGSDETFAVLSPAEPLQWSNDIVLEGVGAQILARTAERERAAAGAAARAAADQVTAARLAAAGTPSIDNPDWVRFLLYANDGFSVVDGALQSPPDDELVIRRAMRSTFPDRHHALFVTFLVGNASLDQLSAGNDLVEATFDGVDFDNATFIVTGTPTFLTDINDYLQGGMATLGGIAVLVMLVVLAVVFRVRWRLLPLLVVVIGVVWSFGIFGLTGRDLSLVTISGLPILIGIGIDFAIQVHNRAEEECADGTDGAFGETLARLGPPMATATVAAVLAFMAMRFSLVPMIRDFGLLLAIGIVALLAAGTVVPSALLGARERRRATSEFPESRIGRVVTWLGSAPPGAVLPFVAIAVLLPVVGLSLERDAAIESDPINWADQSSSSVRNARALENGTGFATTLGLYIETSDVDRNGVFTDELAAFTYDATQAALADHPELVEASSLVSSVADLIDVPGATPLAPTGLDLLQAYGVAPPDVQRLLVAADGNESQVTFWVGPSSLEERAEVVRELEAAIDDPADGAARLPANAIATPAGLARVGVGLLENLTANRIGLTVIALLAVAAWVVLRFQSVGRALLTLVPVLVAVGAASTLVSVLGITLSPLTTVSGPLVIATCAEFSVLILGRFLEERAAGRPAADATTVASQRTGRAFVASALTTVGGFGVLVFAALPLLRDFGAIVTLNVAVALLAALVIVPPAAVWADGRGLLGTEPGQAGRTGRIAATVVGLVLAAGAVGASAAALDEDEAPVRTPTTVPAALVPATLPPSTTTTTTTLATGDTLPPGPAERPDGLVAGAVYDLFVGAGAEPGVARCTADTLLDQTSESDLLALGIAQQSPEAVALVRAAAERCGVPASVLDALG